MKLANITPVSNPKVACDAIKIFCVLKTHCSAIKKRILGDPSDLRQFKILKSPI